MVQSAEDKTWGILQDPTPPPSVERKSGALEEPPGSLKVVTNIVLGLAGSTAMLGSVWLRVSALLALGMMLVMLIVWAVALAASPAMRVVPIALIFSKRLKLIAVSSRTEATHRSGVNLDAQR